MRAEMKVVQHQSLFGCHQQVTCYLHQTKKVNTQDYCILARETVQSGSLLANALKETTASNFRVDMEGEISSKILVNCP